MAVNIITRSISSLLLLLLLLSSFTKGSSNDLIDFQGEEETEEARELRPPFHWNAYGRYFGKYSSGTCRDRRGVIYTAAPCTEIPFYRRERRNLRGKKRGRKRFQRGWRFVRRFRTQCKKYTCAEVDCDSDIGKTQCPQTCGFCTTLWDELEANYTAFASFLEDVHLECVLRDVRTSRTVFAPDDATFTNFLAEERVANYSDMDVWGKHAKQLAMYLIVRQRLLTEDIDDDDEVTTAEGNTIEFTVIPPTTLINGAATITDPDIEVRNGVVHGIDDVLLPPSATTTTWEYLQANAATLFDLLHSDDRSVDFETLLNDGPYTVFAPTDAAFDAVDLSGLTSQQIDDILKYHVVAGNHLSYELYWAGNKEMLLENKTLSFDARYFILYINYQFGTPNPTGARTIEKNVLLSTGIVHAIDSVLIPPADDP